jgi:hypothetical protein
MPASSPFGPDEAIGPRIRAVEIGIGDEAEVDHPVGGPIGGIGGGQIGAADQIDLARIDAAAIGMMAPMIRSASPSWSTSPAAATDRPA